jgi:CBS domain-containing protein
MRARDVMTAPVVTIGSETPFKEILAVLINRDVSGLPVVDERGVLVGIVTEADLFRKEALPGTRPRLLRVAADLLSGDRRIRLRTERLTARTIMTPFPMTARPDEEVDRLAQHMLEYRIKRLPVVDQGRVVGIVTRHDLLRALDRSGDLVGPGVGSCFPDPMRVLDLQERTSA